MPGGEVFNDRQRDEIGRAIRFARQESGLPVSIYVGALGSDAQGEAHRLHGQLDSPQSRALVAVDPQGRRVEIVTGVELRRRLDDRSCGLAAVSMTSAFAAGDLAGGIVNGVQTLAEHARAPRSMHTESR